MRNDHTKMRNVPQNLKSRQETNCIFCILQRGRYLVNKNINSNIKKGEEDNSHAGKLSSLPVWIKNIGPVACV